MHLATGDAMGSRWRCCARTYRALIAAVIVGVAATGCAGGRVQLPTIGTSSGQHSSQAGTANSPGSDHGDHTVQLTVSNGAIGQVLAFAPVYINGDGPYQFAIDTGASKSVVDQSLATELDLPSAGISGGMLSPQNGGATSVSTVQVQNWRVGDITLDPATLVVTDLPSAQDQPGLGRLLGGGQGLDGLLGSDILSGYGSVTLDYSDQLLTLGQHPNQTAAR